MKNKTKERSRKLASTLTMGEDSMVDKMEKEGMGGGGGGGIKRLPRITAPDRMANAREKARIEKPAAKNTVDKFLLNMKKAQVKNTMPRAVSAEPKSFDEAYYGHVTKRINQEIDDVLKGIDPYKRKLKDYK